MSDFTDISLHRVSTAEAVVEALIGLIVSGTLAAGEPLRESSLAKQLRISRNTLREAIRLLERSRLVKYEIHRGAIVSTPTLRDLQDLYVTRRQLELTAVMQEPTEEQIHRLHEAFEELTLTAEQHAAVPIVIADLAFHQAIVDLLDSDRISSFYQQIRTELMFYFTVLSHTDAEYESPKASIVDRHEGIYRAIVAGEHVRAHELLAALIEENYARLKEILMDQLAAADSAAAQD